jgi:hypothetical protein
MFGRQPLSTAPFCYLLEQEQPDAYQRLRARDLSGPAFMIRDESEGAP